MKTTFNVVGLIVLLIIAIVVWRPSNQEFQLDSSPSTLVSDVQFVTNSRVEMPPSKRIPAQRTEMVFAQTPGPCLSERWRLTWSKPEVKNDPGRVWLSERLAELNLPAELAIEIGNAAWEQAELRRVAEMYGPLAPEAVEFVARLLSSARKMSLTSLGYEGIDNVWTNFLAAPVSSPVQISPPVMEAYEQSLDESVAPCDETLAKYSLASDSIKSEFGEFYEQCSDWLERLGYHPAWRSYYLRRVAEDLRDIWTSGMNSEDLDPTYHGMRPLAHFVSSSNPPHGRPILEQSIWLYRVMAIKFMTLQGGPADERFYQDVYSQGMVGFLPPL